MRALQIYSSCGLTPADDILPNRLEHEPLPMGAAGKVLNLPKMLDEYYNFRGWREEGVPGESKLKQLDLL